MLTPKRCFEGFNGVRKQNVQKKLNYFIRKHKKDTQNKIRKLKSKSLQQFWKILNSKRENKNISMNDLCNFFKDINSPNDSHDPESENLNFSIDYDDEILIFQTMKF